MPETCFHKTRQNQRRCLRKSQAKQKATDAHNLRANTTKQSEKGDKKGVQIIGNMCGNVWECV